MSKKETILAFDLYGTLLSTESIAKDLGEYFDDDKSRLITQLWRRYQLEYTWRLNSMGCYLPFREVTKNALEHALEETGSSLAVNEIDKLLLAYDSLATFPDTGPALERISQTPSVSPVIFSNGTAEMLRNSVARSTVLSQHESAFDHVITVDDVQKYKPAREVYECLARRVGKDSTGYSDIWLISGNPFDIMGALNVGLKAIWVDRAKAGWRDQAMPNLRPTAVVHSLEEIVDVVFS